MSTARLECPYELIELIGEGSMGQVYLARHMTLNRLEALKVLSPGLAKAKDFVARLRREARAASMLTHPNIVAVFGLGRLEDGRYYLAMEHLVGESLEVLLDREAPLADGLGLRLLYQLASAMSQAHEQSVVHRDIKPANIMVVDQEWSSPNIKVLDFGLAKIISPSYVDSVSSSVAGHLFGTPGFMAPERVRAVPSAPNMDVYSFGCVAYNLMTGRAPFIGHAMDVLRAHQSDTPLLPSERCEVNKELEAIVMRCLSKEPSGRPADGLALCQAMESIAGFSPMEARRRSTLATVEDTLPGITAHPGAAQGQGQSTLLDIRVEAAVTHTLELGSEHAVIQYRQALLALAKALVEGGCQDTRLVMRFASAYQAEAMLREHTEELASLIQEGEALEQRFRREQSTLRFALNDLSFHASEDAASQDRQAAEARANDLTEDLVRAQYKFDRSLQAIIDAEVTQAALRSSVEESLQGEYTELLQLVDDNIESSALTPAIESLLRTFERAQSAYELCIRQRG